MFLHSFKREVNVITTRLKKLCSPAQWPSGTVSALRLVGCVFDLKLGETKDIVSLLGTQYLGLDLGG